MRNSFQHKRVVKFPDRHYTVGKGICRNDLPRHTVRHHLLHNVPILFHESAGAMEETSSNRRVADDQSESLHEESSMVESSPQANELCKAQHLHLGLSASALLATGYSVLTLMPFYREQQLIIEG